MKDVIYWVWLASKNGPGGVDAHKLLKHFPGGARDIFEASREELLKAEDCSPQFLRRLEDHDLKNAENVLEFCFINGIRVIHCASDSYPRRLHDVYNKPLVLYVRGHIEDLDDRFCVSIVGTRDMSGYGKHMTFMLARQLIGYGAIIISGAAYGIDSSANNTAMYMESETVAVLGSGVNVPYPASNKDLLDWIGEHGMVVSEFEPNTPPHGRNFPIRNRIISGLADAVVIVEAGEKSGALITARRAADQHRRVYAVPGNVGAPNSFGTNNLIRDGAKLCTRAEDIVEDFVEEFGLHKVDKIVNSDRYRRYEYQHSVPVLSENMPIPAKQQEAQRAKAAPVPPAREKKPRGPLPDIPQPADFKKAGAEIENRPIPSERPDTDVPRPIREAPVREPSEPAEEAPSGAFVSKPDAGKQRERLLSLLTDEQRQVLDAIPENSSVTTDQIAQTGIPADSVMSSLTFLELYAAVEAMPGGFYKKLI